jgi:hypothetical protein
MEDIQKTIQASIVEALAGLGTGDIATSRDGTDPIKSIAIGNFEINFNSTVPTTFVMPTSSAP